MTLINPFAALLPSKKHHSLASIRLLDLLVLSAAFLASEWGQSNVERMLG
jgi:hypothetical protein